MMCKKCGSLLEDNALFCANCGSKVEPEVTENVNLEQPVQPVQPVQESVQSPIQEPVQAPVQEPVQATSMNNFDNNSYNNSSMNESNNNKSSNLKNALIILFVCLLLGGAAFAAYMFFFKKDGEVEDKFNNKKDIEAIGYAVSNMSKNLDSFNLKFNFNLAAKENGEDVNVDFSALFGVDLKNRMMSANINASSDGMSLELPAYLDLNSTNALYFNIPLSGDEWYKISLGDIIDLDDLGDLDLSEFEFESGDITDEDIEKLNSISENLIEKAKSDDKNVDKYIIHYTKELIEELVDDGYSEYDMDYYEEVGLADGFDIELYINNVDNYITKIAFDLSGKTVQDVQFDKFIFSMEITDVNKVSAITVPTEALSAEEFDFSGAFSSLMGGSMGNQYSDFPTYEPSINLDDYNFDF